VKQPYSGQTQPKYVVDVAEEEAIVFAADTVTQKVAMMVHFFIAHAAYSAMVSLRLFSTLASIAVPFFFLFLLFTLLRDRDACSLLILDARSIVQRPDTPEQDNHVNRYYYLAGL
jgi:hypothetical protein